MKVGAHPMVVAVALGLLGPASLEVSETRERRPCEGCTGDERGDDVGSDAADPFALTVQLGEASPATAAYWEEVHAPSEAERAEVAAAWAAL